MDKCRKIVLIAGILLLCGCSKEEVDEAFLESTTLCLINDGRTVHSYDPLTWQIAYSEDKMEFRVYSDTMSDYYVLSCSQLPAAEGQEISATLEWSNSSRINRKSLGLSVEKIDLQGRIWLWSSKEKIAVSVMRLE